MCNLKMHRRARVVNVPVVNNALPSFVDNNASVSQNIPEIYITLLEIRHLVTMKYL